MLKATVGHWSPRATLAAPNPQSRQLRLSTASPLPRRQPHFRCSPCILNQRLQPVSYANSTSASSLSQRIPPVLLTAEAVCIAAAACLQLASLYVLQTNILTKYSTPPPATNLQPPADVPTEAAEHLATSTTPDATTSLQESTATTEAVLQAGSTTSTQPEDPTTSQPAVTSVVAAAAAPAQFTDALVSTSWLGALQGLLLCTALFCNALLRGRLPASPDPTRRAAGASSATTSTTAAAQLVKLEVAVNAHTAQLTKLSQQLEKLELRTRLSSSELKRPLQALQQQVAQHAGVMSELAEGQVKLQKEAQDAQLLIAALQSVSAKQFKVLAEAIQQANATRAPAKPTAAARAAPKPPAAAASQNGARAAQKPSAAAATQNGASTAPKPTTAAAPQNGARAAPKAPAAAAVKNGAQGAPAPAPPAAAAASQNGHRKTQPSAPAKK